MSYQSGSESFPPGRPRPGGRPPAPGSNARSRTSGSRSDRSVTPTPGPNPVNPQWSQTSAQRERLRRERDRLERIEAADIWDNGTWPEISAIAHGGQRNTMETTPVRLRLNRSQATPSTQSPINPYTELAYRDNYETPRQGLSRRRQTSPSTQSSTNPYQGIYQADPAGTGFAYGGVGLFPPQTPEQQRSIPSDNNTTPTTVQGGGDIFQQLADELREHQHQRQHQLQEEEARRQEDQSDYDSVLDRIEADRQAEYRTIWRARSDDANRLRSFDQVRDDRVTAAFNAWFTTIPVSTQNRYIEYYDDCWAGTTTRYQAYRAMLWIESLPEAVVQAIQHAIDAEKEIDRLSWECDEAWECSEGNDDFIPDVRETYPPPSTGEFGDELNQSEPDEHVCEPGVLCDFIKLHDLVLEPGSKPQIKYMLGALHIRMQRVKLARRKINELGDDAHKSHHLAFGAFHCWLEVALDYVHQRASPTGHHTIAQEFREAGKEFSYGVEEQWTIFEQLFRHTVGLLFSGRKKQHWETRVGYKDRDPLTGQLFDQRGEVNPRLYFPPECFETEDYVVDEPDVPSTPVARPRLMPGNGPTGLALPRIVRSPRSSPRRSATPTSLRRRSATPTERPRSEREASVSSARSSELGDDEDMEDEPEVPRRRRRGGRKVSRTARHLPAVAEKDEEMEEDDGTGDDDELEEDEEDEDMENNDGMDDGDELDQEQESEAGQEHEEWEGFEGEEDEETEEDEEME
ncbi:hypothetical protein PRZ48_008997 [Zasmidium cellare]|uniref:Uncharacterized protein n=1 Tax=Zasmidium cellare TaxID=395010 RepID=A0ABR0EI26_ZASCE|nr:hypothetical protein PRZ48_008997 [Zasmidium cellare]